MKSQNKRSPLKEKPLRYPGQSLDEQIQKLWEKVDDFFTLTAGFVAMAIYIWLMHLTGTSTNPYAITLISVIFVIVLVFRVRKTRQEVSRLKMARDGERIVAEALEKLRVQGASIFHDLKGNEFNVDHVIISRQGIFVVETKTYSKPLKGDARVRVQNEKVFVDGYEMERNPIQQVKALMDWVRGELEKSTGKKYPVGGVILFPGWYIEANNSGKDIWVLNENSFPKFFANEKIAIPESDMHMASYHLSKLIRLM